MEPEIKPKIKSKQGEISTSFYLRRLTSIQCKIYVAFPRESGVKKNYGNLSFITENSVTEEE